MSSYAATDTVRTYVSDPWPPADLRRCVRQAQHRRRRRPTTGLRPGANASLPLRVASLPLRGNDRDLDVDNGTRGTVRVLEPHSVVIETDAGELRELNGAYAAAHVEHAYALTGHGMQGCTVEAAVVLTSPEELTAGWSNTALSRARGTTQLLIHDVAAAAERSHIAPSEHRAFAREDLMERIERRMLERDDEDLAIGQLFPEGAREHESRRDVGLVLDR